MMEAHDSSGKAWGQAIYYQLLLETAMHIPRGQFEQIERLAVLLLVELLIGNGGGLKWSLTQIREEIGVSEPALLKTIKKLQDPGNPFAPFLNIQKVQGKNHSYHLMLIDWIRDAANVKDERNDEEKIEYLSLPMPTSLAAVLPEIYAHFLGEPLWQVEQTIEDGLVVQVKVLRTNKQNSITPQAFPRIDIASLFPTLGNKTEPD